MFGEWCTVLVYEWWTCSSSVGVCIQLSCGHSQWWYWGYFLLEIKARYLRMCLSERECVGKWASLCVHARERERETVCASSTVCHSGYGVSLPFHPLPSSHTHALSCTHSNMHTLSHVQKPVAYLNILFSTVLIQYASHWDLSRTCRTCHTMTTDAHVEIKSHKCFPDSIAWTLYKMHRQQHQMNKVVWLVSLVIHENVHNERANESATTKNKVLF